MKDFLRRIKFSPARKTPQSESPLNDVAVGEVAKDTPPTTAKPPAGTELQVSDHKPSTRSRAKIRKRLRYLRRVHELRLRDLGGYIFEIHRTGTRTSNQAHCEEITRNKLARLATTDHEIGELESRLLTEVKQMKTVRVPGIGGECRECGEIFGTESRFCSNCGEQLRGKKSDKRREIIGQVQASSDQAPQDSSNSSSDDDRTDSEQSPHLEDQNTTDTPPGDPTLIFTHSSGSSAEHDSSIQSDPLPTEELKQP